MTPAEQVKSRLDVVTVIQGYLKLERAGINFKARCPFHSEKTPSFFVSPARDTWHCFGCGKGGDIFEFVMAMDGIDFPEALRLLADRAGVTLDTRSGGESQSNKGRLYELLEEATKFFESNLASYASVGEYLEHRGLIKKTIKDFRLGFAPDSWRALGDHLRRAGFTDTEIEKCGLQIQGTRGPYDRFRSRIIFPLQDALGRPIGFGGRIFDDGVPRVSAGDAAAKYINSPQTFLYDKSRYLYGIDKARQAIRSTGSVVIVEGYMDLILSHQANVENTVAVSGTALTEAHMRSLRRAADTVVFAFDVDAAGVEASRRALDLAYRHDFHVKIADIEGGKDPADIVQKNPDEWKKIVDNSVDSIAFFLKKSIVNKGTLDPLAKKRIGEEILPLVGRLSNEIERGHWIGELSRLLRVSDTALWRELEKHSNTPEVPMEKTEVIPSRTQHMSRKARLEERIAGLVLADPKLFEKGELPSKADCSLATTGEVFEHLTKRITSATVNEILEGLPEDVRHEASRFLFEAEAFVGDGIERETEFLNILHAWKELSLKEKLTALREEIEKLERIGKKEESKRHMEEFQRLTVHLASIVSNHSYYNEEKNKKENRS